VPRARSSVLGRQPVAHERHRRSIIFGVDGGLADGAGLAGGGHIDGTAGEVDGDARLAGFAGGRGPEQLEQYWLATDDVEVMEPA
jgi:hypothetical protein